MVVANSWLLQLVIEQKQNRHASCREVVLRMKQIALTLTLAYERP